MTTPLLSKDLLSKILASIPKEYERMLQIKVGEPNALQLLKLTIRAFFHNILRFPYLEIYGNDLLKALWLVNNKYCASAVFEQYNYMDYYPFTEENDFIPPFATIPNDIVSIWNMLLQSLPIFMGVNNSLRAAVREQSKELLLHFDLLAETERENNDNLYKQAVKILFDVGEYNCALTKFLDIFLPIDRTEDDEIYASKQCQRDTDTKANKPIFSDQTMCLLALSGDGSRILTILSETSDKNPVI